MNFLSNFHFIRPAWLLLLPVAIGLGWLLRRSHDPLGGWRKVMAHDLLTALTVGASSHSVWRQAGLLFGWILAIFSLAGPTWRLEPSPFADDPIPLMLLLRADKTMELTDFSPSRMERARLKIKDLAEVRKGEPLGLIAYAGSAHLVLPPTRDTAVVATMAAEISPKIMPESGDDLLGALRLADRSLARSGGSILVMADQVNQGIESSLTQFRANSRTPIRFLAIAQDNTPALKTIQQAASDLRADVTRIEPDLSDIDALVKKIARTRLPVEDADGRTQWAEDGWWLIPCLALLSLNRFRRDRNPQLREDTV